MHYLAEYQTFNTTYELNNAVYEHIKRNCYVLNTTDRATLKVIARYAVKFAGAAHLKAETLAELIGKSVKTARREVNKLADLGIVRKISTTRKVSGGKGANIIQILPLQPVESTAGNLNTNDDQSTLSTRPGDEMPTESKLEEPKIEKEPSNLINHFKKHLSDTVIPANALKGAIPSVIYDEMARYFNAEDIYKYYGVLIRAKASVDKNVLIEDDPEPFIEAWNASLLKAKRGQINGKLTNYLFVSWQQATHVVLRRKNRFALQDLLDEYYNS